jgi:putative ABC transport system ATP-binding protein
MDILRSTAKQQGTGIAMVTHSPEHAAWADRVCFLKDGIVAGTHLQQGNKDAVSEIYAHLLQLGI